LPPAQIPIPALGRENRLRRHKTNLPYDEEPLCDEPKLDACSQRVAFPLKPAIAGGQAV
jgi:hypothetical protein